MVCTPTIIIDQKETPKLKQKTIQKLDIAYSSCII